MIERNSSVLKFLKRFRYPILALMVIASRVNALCASVVTGAISGQFWQHTHGSCKRCLRTFGEDRLPLAQPVCPKMQPPRESGTSCHRIRVLSADIYL